MALVFLKRVKVGLNGAASFQKDNPNSIAWNVADKSLPVVYHAAYAPMKVGYSSTILGYEIRMIGLVVSLFPEGEGATGGAEDTRTSP